MTRQKGVFVIECHGQAELLVRWPVGAAVSIQCAICGADVLWDGFQIPKDEAPGWVPGASGAASRGVQPADSTTAAPEDSPRDHTVTTWCGWCQHDKKSVGPSTPLCDHTSNASDKDRSDHSGG